ncbi:chemokine-like factor [Thamnophis elegans]|uniref:chemokine-like factor n=1 Tax=Thamnophis elegans TaxID=35005 RepID=UPI0013779D08|nr:chemokine-like factor [Thamnophis elegans]
MDKVDRQFPRSVSGILKAARMVVAFMAIITFVVKRSHEAFLALVIMELVITFLFYLLYLLKLDVKLKFMFWPLADAFNSLVAALFLIIVGLCATIIKTNKQTLIGGIFCLILCGLCIADATLILKKVNFKK